MDDLSRKLRSVDWKSLQKSARRMQQSTASALKDLVMTDLENKTRSATSDTPWGASTTDLQAIAQGTYNRDDYALIMSIVWQRLGSSRWRCVYKALEVLRHLLMHGSSRCLEEARAALSHLETLRMYRKVEGGRDVGEGVRRRADAVVEMLRDDAVLHAEREKSDLLRRKMVGAGAGADAAYSGAYSAGGTYDDSAGDPVTRVRTSAFKGYDDDDDDERTTGAYDDASPALKGYGEQGRDTGGPGGSGANTARVDDLLGADPVDDDDEFDPRAGANADTNADTSAAEGVGELFGALALAGGDTGGVAAAQTPAAKEPTSALVARLAALKGAGTVVPAAQHAPPVDNTSAGGGGQRGSIWDDVRDEAGAGAHVSKAQKAAMAKKEEDPFGDLLATARKTVL